MKLTDEILVGLTEDLIAGDTLAQACRVRNLPYQTTRNAMIRSGMNDWLPAVSPKTAKAAEMWNAGLTLQAVGSALGISKQGAAYILRTAQKRGLLTRAMGHQVKNKVRSDLEC